MKIALLILNLLFIASVSCAKNTKTSKTTTTKAPKTTTTTTTTTTTKAPTTTTTTTTTKAPTTTTTTTASKQTNIPVSAKCQEIFQAELFSKINEVRAEHGTPLLRRVTNLDSKAQTLAVASILNDNSGFNNLGGLAVNNYYDIMATSPSPSCDNWCKSKNEIFKNETFFWRAFI